MSENLATKTVHTGGSPHKATLRQVYKLEGATRFAVDISIGYDYEHVYSRAIGTKFFKKEKRARKHMRKYIAAWERRASREFK